MRPVSQNSATAKEEEKEVIWKWTLWDKYKGFYIFLEK